MIGCSAFLRVYEPLDGLPDHERARWAPYVESGTSPSRPVLMAMEHEAALAAVLAVPPRTDVGHLGDHAYVRHHDGRAYVCPWRLQLRAWAALEDFRALLPDEIAEAFLPLATAAAAEVEHDAWVTTNPDVEVGIRSSTWSIPTPWFALFEADERRLVLGERRSSGAPPHTGLDRALVYVTAMSRARRRVARGLHVLKRVFEDGPVIDAVEEIGRWLEAFHPHSIVELDYGGLVHLVDDETLGSDDSVGEIAGAIERLAEGDTDGASARYESVVSRWRAIAALEHAN
ncbi:MAG: hypothetical protein JO222_09860 [Frankiales bacterium]|nr:hypothetical protein [Frankiales bacterium]